MEQTRKHVSYESVDQAIFDFEQAVLKSFPHWQTEHEYNQAEYDHKQIMNGIKYYILTDRAPLDFMSRFVNLDKRGFMSMARKCWKAKDKSINSIIQACKQVLRVGEASA